MEKLLLLSPALIVPRMLSAEGDVQNRMGGICGIQKAVAPDQRNLYDIPDECTI